MDLRSGIIETARALQMDPVDLATIISFESGFNPNVWGGKGGQHYGLIQFGPNERQQYGVAVGDPSSQLGAKGAIANYFWDRGWKPGMSFLDAYSIVNAGGPGLYNRSDTAAGGTQGTVRDKVTGQMADDRTRAQAFLGNVADSNQTILDQALRGRFTGPNARRPAGPLEAAGGGTAPDMPNRFTRRPGGPLEAAGGGFRPDRFTRRPGGPLEAAGGGSLPDMPTTYSSGAYGPYTGNVEGAVDAAIRADDRQEERKDWWKKHFDPSGGADTLAGIGGASQSAAGGSGYPGASRADAPDVSNYYAQMAAQQREALAMAMARLNERRAF